MLMGGWLVNLVSKHRRSSPHCSSGQRRQMLSSNLFHLFPTILFISVPGEKNLSTCMSMFDFFLPPWFVCGARFVWEKLGSVLIQESCVGLLSNNIERDTLWNISHTTQHRRSTWERGSIMWKCGVGILYEAGTVDGIENNPWHIAQIRGYPQ